VDGIVKGLKAPGWPTDGWQALHRLAMDLCLAVCLPSGGGQGPASGQRAAAAPAMPLS